MSNTGWLKRDLSTDMLQALKATIDRCSSEVGPVYFPAVVTEGDVDIGKGNYEVGCVPGSEIIRSQVTSLDLAHAYLASDDLPHAKRQGNFQWKYRFAKMADYVKNTPNATFAGDKAFCVNMLTELKEKYTFTENHRAQADYYLEQCPTTDFNWQRKRHGVPEITQ